MKVDVLEFFDWMGDEIPYTNEENTAKFHAARAAIAELIEAVKHERKMWANEGKVPGWSMRIAAADARLVAALKGCGHG